jgi:hypothetical protein
MFELPTWLEYAKAFGTPIVALLVGVIALLQWRTAHQKVVLDLFDKRVRIIDDLRRVVSEILQGGKVENIDSDKFLRATRGADFLFGPKVTKYLDRMHNVLLDLQCAT